MNPTLDSLRRAARPTRAAVDRFIKAHEFPIVDESGVTFVWRGKAEAVRLRTWAYGLPGSLALEPVGRSDLWALRIEVPPGARLEYKFEVLADGGSSWVVDPLNRHQAPDPFGHNSVCRARGYERPSWTLPSEGIAHGTIDELPVAIPGADTMGSQRVWLPPDFRRSRSYPLLVVHDGGDFLRYSTLDTVLDNLVHRLDIPEMIVALHEPVDRTRQYTASEHHARALGEVLLPHLEKAYPLDGQHGLMGASLGAVASLHAAWLAPQTWQHLALLSGSFTFSDLGPHGRDALFDPVVRFVNRFRRSPAPLDAQWYVACGVHESLIHENRALVSLLSGHRVRMRYDEVPDGHHWECWRDRLRDALGWLYAGPMWMIYE